MKNQGLYDKLIEYGKTGNYGFHMPGHKRNVSLLEGMDPFSVDITEITDFDNLHHATGVIKEAMDNAAKYWGTDKTWFLVNGSSCGILAAINAVTDIGDSIVIGRNCHKAVYNAVALRNLQVQYLYPEYIEKYGLNGGYNPDELKKILNENKNVKAVVITSPTYDGIVSDIEAIAEVTHKYGVVLIVDEAHGAHLGISDKLPKPAYKLGADLVIESVHKTLPALTQTAILHLAGERVSCEKVEECLGIYESSSPSYVLMASIDKCIRELQTNGKDRMEKLLTINKEFRNNVNNLNNIYVPGAELIGEYQVYDVDLTKLIICVNPDVCDGKQLADMLRTKYHFEMEMESARYVLGITSICDDENEIIRLAKCLKEIDVMLDEKLNIFHESIGETGRFNLEETGDKEKVDLEFGKRPQVNLLRNKVSCSVYEAKKKKMKSVEIANSEGMVSGEFLYLYPPGIPLLVPGEIISRELLDQIAAFKRMKMNINGLKDKENCYIDVVASC